MSVDSDAGKSVEPNATPLLPASVIDRIEWAPGDYETELRFHERVGIEDHEVAHVPHAIAGIFHNNNVGHRGEDFISEISLHAGHDGQRDDGRRHSDHHASN